MMIKVYDEGGLQVHADEDSIAIFNIGNQVIEMTRGELDAIVEAYINQRLPN